MTRREDETTGKTYGKWAKIPKAWNRNDMSMSIILFLILHNYIIIVESFVSGQVEFSMIWHFGWNSKKKHCSGFRYLPFSYLGSGFKQLHCHN